MCIRDRLTSECIGFIDVTTFGSASAEEIKENRDREDSKRPNLCCNFIVLLLSLIIEYSVII